MLLLAIISAFDKNILQSEIQGKNGWAGTRKIKLYIFHFHFFFFFHIERFTFLRGDFKFV